MHGQIGALDALELGLDSFLGRVDQHRAFLAKHQFFHLYEAPQGAVADFPGVDFVNLALIGKNDFENVTGCHLRMVRDCYPNSTYYPGQCGSSAKRGGHSDRTVATPP